MPAAPSGRPSVLADDGLHHAFPHVAAVADGSLRAVWRRASSHMEPDGAVWTATSSDGGTSWSPAHELLTAPHDARDPCLAALSDGRVAMSWFDFDGERSTGVRVSFSDDGGCTFPTTVPLPEPWRRWTAVSAPVVELADGDLVLPVYGRPGRGRTDAALLASADRGRTWSVRSTVLRGRAARTGLSEPWLVPSGDRLTCLLRAESGVVHACRSDDGGRTWGPAERLFTCDSRATWLPLGAGRALAVHRSVIDRAVVLRSTSDGWQTWSHERVLDDRGLCTYSGLAQVAPDAVCAVYGVESPDRRRGRVLAVRLAV